MAIRDPAAMPPPDAKPEYHNIAAVITSIDSEQTMYYMAAPDTGRKVSAVLGRHGCFSMLRHLATLHGDISLPTAAKVLPSMPPHVGAGAGVRMRICKVTMRTRAPDMDAAWQHAS